MGGAQRGADAELPPELPSVAGEDFVGLCEQLFISACCLADMASYEDTSCSKAGWEELQAESFSNLCF